MPKSVLFTATLGFLLLLATLLILAGPARCSDPLGCIVVSPRAPLEIGVLYASPGSNCAPADSTLERLAQQAADAGLQDRVPIAILKEESGFSLESAQQALARLLRRPNLAGVLVLDCQSGADPSLAKMIADAGIPAWLAAAPPVPEELAAWFAQQIDPATLAHSDLFGRRVIGRSSFTK